MTLSSSPPRSVARPVANLGNTCYMNAVLQALAHAPELCLALDCDPHSASCPVAAENALRAKSNSRSASPDDMAAATAVTSGAGATYPLPSQGTRKSSRNRISTGGVLNGGRKSPDDSGDSRSRSPKHMDNWEFCALCEVEHHIRHVHDSAKKDKPVAPSAFVHGFIDQVAPWFQLGVQEDSHEFLRLLIDAMQNSCLKARLQDNPQGDDRPDHDDKNDQDKEYPFSLFRGTVESNVVCESCKASSSTLDPIEDIGLEVTMPPTSTSANTFASAHPPLSSSRSSSRNVSPVPLSSALTDVQTAFQRYARAEALDSGYKCEKCGKVGRATKQSRLASIPPILTLHLKRFRYGDRGAAPGTQTRTRSSREVTQLMGNGKSGSAKIEGHIKFDMFFDLKPYLTDELKAKHANMFCRLFAVIVHAGKNSHSGHYIAFVRNVGKNEWWKMDDSRVTSASEQEVKNAEAYMLFYRVVQHPVAMQLEERCKEKKLREVANAVAMAAASSDEPNNANGNNRKRPFSEICEDGMEWARKANIPPEVMSLVGKVSELISDDIHISAQYYNLIKKKRRGSPRPSARAPKRA